jgi:Fur family transcriptional regulator, stress-responsive regulator
VLLGQNMRSRADAGYLFDSGKWARLQDVPTTARFEGMLHGIALRVTRPPLAALSAVHDHPQADTGPIIGVVREDLGEVSYQAVDDAPRALTAAGLVGRFQPTGVVGRYEARVGDNHHHVVCRLCGAVADVDRAVGYTACLTATDDSGYEIDEAEAIFRGRRCECLAAPSAG